jgi:microcystin-dependent protein
MAVKRYNGTSWVIEAGATPQSILPSGMLAPYAGSTIPAGWLICAGQTVSQSLYANLFASISTTYNTGGEAGTDFRLPDLRGRVIAGIDNMGGTDAGRLDVANTAGTVTGSQYVTLSSANLPLHTHAIDHDHASFATTDGAGSHSHGLLYAGGSFSMTGASTVGGNVNWFLGNGAFGGTITVGSSGSHNHTIDVPNFTGSSGNGGFANTAISVTQPTMVMNYIIKT